MSIEWKPRLPERLGDYRSVQRRYHHWIEMGVLDNMQVTLAFEADLEWLMINSTIVGAHQRVAGLPAYELIASLGVTESAY